jgi:hypothetical protein
VAQAFGLSAVFLAKGRATKGSCSIKQYYWGMFFPLFSATFSTGCTPRVSSKHMKSREKIVEEKGPSHKFFV